MSGQSRSSAFITTLCVWADINKKSSGIWEGKPARPLIAVKGEELPGVHRVHWSASLRDPWSCPSVSNESESYSNFEDVARAQVALLKRMWWTVLPKRKW